jgi:low affinity Fe/Cu permease
MESGSDLTFLMLFVLQHSQNRDGVAIQAKLDTLILHSKGPNSLDTGRGEG